MINYDAFWLILMILLILLIIMPLLILLLMLLLMFMIIMIYLSIRELSTHTLVNAWTRIPSMRFALVLSHFQYLYPSAATHRWIDQHIRAPQWQMGCPAQQGSNRPNHLQVQGPWPPCSFLSWYPMGKVPHWQSVRRFTWFQVFSLRYRCAACHWMGRWKHYRWSGCWLRKPTRFYWWSRRSWRLVFPLRRRALVQQSWCCMVAWMRIWHQWLSL